MNVGKRHPLSCLDCDNLLFWWLKPFDYRRKPCRFPTSSDFAQPDQDLLLQFVRAVHDLLAEVVENPNDRQGEPLFADGLIDPMRAAFLEIPGHFERLYTAVRRLEPDGIAEHGLSGNQLHFKLAAVHYREQVYRQRGGFFRLQWLLDAIEGLLDSIIDAAGVGGAIKEFKEAMRNSGKDRD